MTLLNDIRFRLGWRPLGFLNPQVCSRVLPVCELCCGLRLFGDLWVGVLGRGAILTYVFSCDSPGVCNNVAPAPRPANTIRNVWKRSLACSTDAHICLLFLPSSCMVDCCAQLYAAAASNPATFFGGCC
jgi:hypothetical protein